MTKERKGGVYFVQQGDSGPIKIGVTGDAHTRLKKLQTGNPQELRLLAVTGGGELEEGLVHDLLSDHRIRGEWFRPDAEVLDYISTPDELAEPCVRRAHEILARGGGRPLTDDEIRVLAEHVVADGPHAPLAALRLCEATLALRPRPVDPSALPALLALGNLDAALVAGNMEAARAAHETLRKLLGLVAPSSVDPRPSPPPEIEEGEQLVAGGDPRGGR